MKRASLICAAALVIAGTGLGDAKPAHQKGAKKTVHRAHAIARPAPRPQDPYKAYWNDPSRSGPFSYHGYQ
jgi:hypothetical protein